LPKYWVSIVKLARILNEISGVQWTLFSKKIDFANFDTSQSPLKQPNVRWYVLVIRGADEGSSHHDSESIER